MLLILILGRYLFPPMQTDCTHSTQQNKEKQCGNKARNEREKERERFIPETQVPLIHRKLQVATAIQTRENLASYSKTHKPLKALL